MLDPMSGYSMPAPASPGQLPPWAGNWWNHFVVNPTAKMGLPGVGTPAAAAPLPQGPNGPAATAAANAQAGQALAAAAPALGDGITPPQQPSLLARSGPSTPAPAPASMPAPRPAWAQPGGPMNLQTGQAPPGWSAAAAGGNPGGVTQPNGLFQGLGNSLGSGADWILGTTSGPSLIQKMLGYFHNNAPQQMDATNDPSRGGSYY